LGGVRVALIGFGNVGRKLLLELARLGGAAEVVAVFSSKGCVAVRDSEDLALLTALAERGEGLSAHPKFEGGASATDWASSGAFELAFVAIPPSYDTGEPNLSLYRKLLSSGVSVVTADKTGLALSYWELVEEARRRRLFLGYRATVAAGTPAVDFARGLAGRDVESVEAVLNATTNYVLTLVERGASFEEALARAVEEELAEPDPRVDFEGLDAAAKIAILACELGLRMTLKDVERAPLASVGEDEVRSALTREARYKYVAELDAKKGKAFVRPKAYPAGSPLAKVSGSRNCVVARVEGEELVLEGPAGPAWRTAKVMLTDFFEYLRLRSYMT